MHARVLRCLIVAAALAAAGAARAEAPRETCELPPATSDALTDRAGILAQYERLPQPCLQRLFQACQQASSQGMLDFGSAAACSFGYEALLSQKFRGNFGELMAWWRGQDKDLSVQ